MKGTALSEIGSSKREGSSGSISRPDMSARASANLHVRVRAATAADMPAMIKVVNAAFAIETFLEGTRTDEQRMSEMMRKGEFLVAEAEARKILACIYVERRGERGHFGMLAVDPAWHGKGLGRAIVEAAENHCRKQGCTEMDITVLSLRLELLPLYRKLGYVETGTLAFHPSRPLKDGVVCNSIVMSKKL